MPTIFILITSFIYGTFLESIGKAFGKTLSMQYQFHIPGPSVLGIPLLILLGWCIILSISFFISSEIFLQKKIEGRSIFLFSLFTAYTATSLDTLLDPVGIKEGNWIYRTGGGYFGVPYENFFLWFIGILLFGIIMRTSTTLFTKHFNQGKNIFHASLLIYVALYCYGMYQGIQYRLFAVMVISSLLIIPLLIFINLQKKLFVSFFQYFLKERN